MKQYNRECLFSDENCSVLPRWVAGNSCCRGQLLANQQSDTSGGLAWWFKLTADYHLWMPLNTVEFFACVNNLDKRFILKTEAWILRIKPDRQTTNQLVGYVNKILLSKMINLYK